MQIVTEAFLLVPFLREQVEKLLEVLNGELSQKEKQACPYNESETFTKNISKEF